MREAERARHRERLGVERPARQRRGAVRGLGRRRAPELEAAEQVARRLAQHGAAEQPEAPARDPPPHGLAAADGGARARAASRPPRRSAPTARACAGARAPTARSRRRSAAAARRAPRASRAAATRPCRGSPGCAARARAGRRAPRPRPPCRPSLALSTTRISCASPSRVERRVQRRAAWRRCPRASLYAGTTTESAGVSHRRRSLSSAGSSRLPASMSAAACRICQGPLEPFRAGRAGGPRPRTSPPATTGPASTAPCSAAATCGAVQQPGLPVRRGAARPLPRDVRRRRT